MLVDVHTHLTHQAFAADQRQVIEHAVACGLRAIVVNGLDPASNREILALAATYPVIKPALGIYPVEAVAHLLPADFPHPVTPFDLEAELTFIEGEAKAGHLAAIGECGLDGYWLKEPTYAGQELVFRRLIEIAKASCLPVIIHTRNLEQRAIAILREHQVEKVDFHCFGGRTKHAQECAEKDGWYFSIPANATVNDAFRKMLANLPPERILTETDAPYLPPKKGERNEPANVASTIAILAQLRGWSDRVARETVWANYVALFGERWASEI